MLHRALYTVPCLALALAMACGTSHAPTEDAGASDAGGALRSTGGWLVYAVAETEGEGFGLGMDPSFTIDGEDRFHLVHVHQDRGEVLYSHGAPGSFQTELVSSIDGEAHEIGAASHALAPDGTLHVTYVGDPEPGATYAMRSVDGTYTYRPLAFESRPPDSQHPSVGRLSDGRLVFVGAGPLSGDSGDLEIVAIDGSDEPEPIGTARNWLGLNIQITVTADQHTHALVRHLGGMLLATRAPSGAWRARALEPSPVHASMTATADGVLHAVFVHREADGDFVSYGHGPSDGSSFVEERVASFTLSLGSPSIAVAPDGAVHLAFESPGRTRYASNRSGAWLDEQIEGTSTQNGRPVIAVDSSGRPWVAYRDRWSALVLATPDAAP